MRLITSLPEPREKEMEPHGTECYTGRKKPIVFLFEIEKLERIIA